MATLPFSATTRVTASRFFFGSLWRSVLTWSEELNRAHAATYRYEQLRIGRGNNVPRQDRASKARQVFAELYRANVWRVSRSSIARLHNQRDVSVSKKIRNEAATISDVASIAPASFE